MVGRHQGATKEFGALTFAEQADSIRATTDSLRAAIEHHVEHSPRRLEAIEECLAQVDRLRRRLSDKYEQRDAHSGSRPVTRAVEGMPRIHVGSPRLAEPERAADFAMEVAQIGLSSSQGR